MSEDEAFKWAQNIAHAYAELGVTRIIPPTTEIVEFSIPETCQKCGLKLENPARISVDIMRFDDAKVLEELSSR